MALASTNAQSFIASPGALLSLYELDSRYISPIGEKWLFHAGVNGIYQPIIFDGLEYTPFPLEITEMALDGKGTTPRPKLSCSNINGFVSQLLLQQGDLVGARFVRRRVFSRFLDAVNFPGGVNPFGTPDPSAAYEDEVYFVNRKVREDPQLVEFELATPWEIDNVQLPRRPMLATVCSAIYRDPETCGYAGVPVSDRFGKLFTASAPDGYGYTLSDKGLWSSAVTYQIGDYVTIISQSDFTYGETLVYVCAVADTTGVNNQPQFNDTNWVADACPHNLFGCKAHYATGPLPFLAYPGTSRASYTN